MADKRSFSLLWTCVAHLRRELLAGVLPRLACISFTFAQPFLIEQTLNTSDRQDGNKHDYVYGTIAAYAIVYVGIAVRGCI